MVDRVRLVGAGLLALCAACAAAPVPPPQVCGDPGVLRQVGDIIRARGQELTLEAPPVGEVSRGPGAVAVAMAVPPLAQCAVRGHTVGYDTNRYGTSPIHEPFTVSYTVEMRRNGLFVQVDRVLSPAAGR